MSPRRTDEASRITSALTGASVALGIAREAMDAVPIVKQVLGAALRIVGLAEKMDNDREALRALGASSLQLSRQVTAVMAGKTPKHGIQESLERILRALDDIEKFMKEHAARNRLRRFVSYAFTVPQHVKRLSGELADAARDLTVVALLDVDHQVQATHTAVEDNARFQGEFRLLRHCEVEKLDHLFDRKCGNEANGVFRYHRASVDGKLLVVRYFEGSVPPQSPPVQAHEETFKRIAVHDAILEEISSVQRSHPNVARIYGWSRGSTRERFTVFKSGYQRVDSALNSSPNPLITGIHWAFKLLEAVQYLHSLGIVWAARSPYALDDHLQPIIGLQNDLGRIDQNKDQHSLAVIQMHTITYPLGPFSERQSVPAAEIERLLAGLFNERLISLLSRMESIHRNSYILPKDEFSQSRILTDTAAEGLLRMLEGEAFDYESPSLNYMWGNIFLALDRNRSHALMRGLRVDYHASTQKPDSFVIYSMDHDSECIVYDVYTIVIPEDQQDEVREMVGISEPFEKDLWAQVGNMRLPLYYVVC